MEHFSPLGGPNSDPTLFNLIQEEQWERAWELVARNPAAPYMSNGRVDRDDQRFPLHELCRMVKFMDHVEDNEFSGDEEEEVFTDDERERNEQIYGLARFMIVQSQTIQEGFQETQERVLVQSFRESILTLTEGGNTPLHVLCHESADTTMIRLLVECAPSEENYVDALPARAVDLIRIKNHNQCTPVHFLVENAACPYSALKLMVQYSAIPAGPSHIFDARLIGDHDGNIPLHYAFAAGISPRRISTLVSGCHDTLLTANFDSRRPFQKYVDEYCENFDSMENDEKLALWDDIQALVKVVTGWQDDDDTWSPLHAIASGINFVPEAIWSIALTFESDRRNTHNQDGLLPLHAAISSPPLISTRHEAYLSMMREIMHSYPEAVRMPTSRGRLALHLAIEAGQEPWIISMLLLEAPQALLTIDPVTGLLPFMLAAVGDTSTLTTVYELLRKDPSILLARQRCSAAT